jgi:type IV secretory pathway VirB2 component (pilin)
MIEFAIQFIIFCVVVVIVVLGAQWVFAKLGWTLDPTLKAILGLFAFLVLLIIFLNMIGYMSGIALVHHRY